MRKPAAKSTPKPAAKPGRPSAYQPDYPARLVEYFDPKRNIAAGTLPLLSGFAWELGVHRETLNNWAAEHPDFFDAYRRAKDAQEVILSSGALSGNFNATFAGLTAKNILGWRDRQDLEHSGPNGQPIQFAEVRRTIHDPAKPEEGR